jgi:hypothetical protein
MMPFHYPAVRTEGLEPPPLAGPVSKTGAAAITPRTLKALVI